jgi:hypothetical protein
MNVENLLLTIKSLIGISQQSFSIGIGVLSKQGSQIVYNKFIRETLGKKPIFGVYIWVNPGTGEVLYIGMSGKLKWTDDRKSEVVPGSYSVQKRLVSSRGTLNGKKDISTWEYLRDKVFKEENLESMSVYVLGIEPNQFSPSYIESLLLQNFYHKTEKIPRYNKSF